MVKRFLFPLIFASSCLFISCRAQQHFNKSYIDLIVKDSTGYALSQNGGIDIFNVNTNLLSDTGMRADSDIIALTLDTKGVLVVAQKGGQVARLDSKTMKFKPFFKSKDKIFNIIYDHNNTGYLVTRKGITNLSTHKTTLPDTTVRLNHQVRGWQEPASVYIDNNDNIWLGYGFGEWGGELFIFSTKENKFVKPTINECPLDPIKSIFSDGHNIYMSCGVQHMDNYGEVLKFINYNCSTILISETQWKKKENGSEKISDGEYIGPAAFNKRDSCLYFYSQHGLFKGDLKNDLSKLDSWVKLPLPALQWHYGQRDAAGYQMNVLKMVFAPNGKLFIVTQNDGLCVFDGKTSVLLK